MTIGRDCTICKQFKLLEHFNKCSSKLYGVQNRCRDCCKEISRRDRLNNLEEHRTKRNSYYASRREYLRNKIYEGRNKNPENAKAISRKSYKKHQNKHLKNKKDYYNKNKEVIIAKVQKYAKDKQYEVIYRHMKYGSKKRGFGVLQMTFDEFVEFRERYKECHYCHNELPQRGSGMDRVDNSIGYLISNVVPCCTVCNKIRGDNLTHEETVVAIKAVLDFRNRKTDY